MTTPNRKNLLAPQLSKSEVWQDYADRIDEVFATMGIDDARTKLALLRSPMNIKDVVGSTSGDSLIALDSIERQERATLVKTADLLGFRFYDRDLLNNEDYLRLCLFIGQYYELDKGTARFSDFLGFITNAPLNVWTTWTEDYITFYKEDDVAIGTPVYEGGTWYPTTHVILEYSLLKFPGIDRASLVEFFYYFANINVVLWSLEMGDTTNLKGTITGAATHEIWYLPEE